MRVSIRVLLVGVVLGSITMGCRSVTPSTRVDPNKDVAKAGSVELRGVDAVSEPVGGPVLSPSGRSDGFAEMGLPAEPLDRTIWSRLGSGKDDTLARRGSVRCKNESGFVSCLVFGSTGVESLIENAASQGIRSRMIGVRKDVEIEPEILADVLCEETSARKPPSVTNDIACRFERIRAVNENIIVRDLAFELASLLRNDGVIGVSSQDRSGVISCRVQQRNINVQCTVRGIVQGGISEDARALERKESVSMSEIMIETMNEIRKARSQAPISAIPGELAGALRCMIDENELDKSGQRDNVCFVRL
jgi:hypothetical protein